LAWLCPRFSGLVVRLLNHLPLLRGRFAVFRVVFVLFFLVFFTPLVNVCLSEGWLNSRVTAGFFPAATIPCPVRPLFVPGRSFCCFLGLGIDCAPSIPLYLTTIPRFPFPGPTSGHFFRSQDFFCSPLGAVGPYLFGLVHPNGESFAKFPCRCANETHRALDSLLPCRAFFPSPMDVTVMRRDCLNSSWKFSCSRALFAFLFSFLPPPSFSPPRLENLFMFAGGWYRVCFGGVLPFFCQFRLRLFWHFFSPT